MRQESNTQPNTDYKTTHQKAIAYTYASIFESLWKQAELYDELRKSKTQLLSAKDELEEMKKYVNIKRSRKSKKIDVSHIPKK